jgi:hypothetical protein
MAESYLVRASRDGDQFHYLWAARRCLRLLSPQSRLAAIAIEGVSPGETKNGNPADVGEEVIDVAEYFDAEQLEKASLVRYMQLKHSTLHAEKQWTASGLDKTLQGFVRKHKALQQQLRTDDLEGKLEFWFVTNRPVSSDVRNTVEDAAALQVARHPAELEKLEKSTGLTGKGLALFCRLLRFDDKQDDYWEQRNLLFQDMAGYLADSDVDAPTQLKELITRKALSESQSNPIVTKYDVLRVLKTDLDALFPAPCLITQLSSAVPRAQENELIARIVNAVGPVIVHAEGGVGKSIFATRIKRGLPDGSEAILYDCFGNGQYRSPTGYRHRHKDALVQIVNELAGKSLCHPLIPTPHADSSAYLKAFIHRLHQAVVSIKASKAGALLCVIIDAGDNAQIAAEEIGERRSFARDLLRETLPDGVRLVVLCRTHRQVMLDPPPTALPLELKAFSRTETAAHLCQTFPDASEHDIDEFHRLSSHNPRVQSLALSREQNLDDTLRLLGPNPTTVEDTIGQILNGSIAKLRDASATVEKVQIDSVCAGLAALRPLIPIAVLSAISGVAEAAIKSFAFDLGRPLIVTDNTIQFFDEPAETWFRERFKPSIDALASFIDALRPIASKSAYVASVLPQLMLEAGQFAELVSLALSSDALPEASPLERRDVELQRLQFALKASLRGKRYLDAAKLALKAGGETAGETRQRALLQSNTDLAAIFLDTGRIQEVVSRRTFGSGWVGSHHAYEAALMSGNSDLIGEARSRLRMAREWLRNWSRLPSADRRKEEISDTDIAEIAAAHLNIHGAASCAHSLRGWTPREVSYRVGRIIARKMIEHGRISELDQLAIAAENDLCLILAITVELREICLVPPKEVIRRAVRLLRHRRVILPDSNHWDAEERVIGAVTPLVEAACSLSVCNEEAAQGLLTRYLPSEPPRGLASRFGGTRFTFLRAYVLRAALAGQTLKLSDIAHRELRKELEADNRHSDSRDAQEFKEDVGALLPWHELWSRAFLGQIEKTQIANAIENARSASAKAERIHYREESHTSDEIARLWFETLSISGTLNQASIDHFNAWADALKRPLYTPTLNRLARLAARVPLLHTCALSFARRSFDITKGERADAETKSGGYVQIARSILTISRSEAEAYFNEAVEVSNKIGDENLARWGAFLDLADRAAKPGRPASEVAYKLSRCAELTYDYVARDKHFNWDGTVRALGGLCPTSSLAILSRWRDRRFGSEERILPELIESLVEQGSVAALDALPLFGIRASWDEPKLLKPALALCASAERETVVKTVYRFMSLTSCSTERWTELKSVVSAYGVVLSNLDQQIAHNKAKDEILEVRSAENETWRSGREPIDRDWGAIFENLNLEKANDIALAKQRYRSLEPPLDPEDFIQQTYRRIAAGREAEFIRALADVVEFDLYDLRNFLEQIPSGWKTSLAVRAALSSTVKVYARRYCMDMSRSRHYQALPFKLVSGLSGIAEIDLVGTVLEAAGETAEPADAGRLFTLVGLIAVVLSEDEALDALSFGLSLLENTLEAKDGDGPWCADLAPPGDIEGAIAGYIWAGLASPDSALRWESAHCVLSACQLGRSAVLERLISLAAAKQGKPFVDARLPFYDQHARLWLLIALARAAKDSYPALAPHFGFLADAALNGEPHVLMRHFAATAALSVLDSGVVPTDTPLKNKLVAVNSSPFPKVKTNSFQRDIASDENGIEGDDRFYFGIDIGPYWYAPLGRCFAVSQARIEREALRVIRGDWEVSGSSRWDEDERARRGYYRDGDSRHSHGSYPRVEDRTFYLSYHAMMVVAGKLLATVPVHCSPDSQDDDFQQWLRGHNLTRRDGYWLSDRRDPAPLEWPAWKNEKDSDEWRWSTRKEEFDQVMIPAEGFFNLWGYWTVSDGRRTESIHVASALVGRARSLSLLRALQTAKNAHDYKIPAAGDDLEIDHGEFQLKGWVADHYRDRELDGRDPWCGSIKYPPPRPASYIVDLLSLQADTERREWQALQANAVLRSCVWGEFDEKDDDRAHDKGNRLQASKEFVVEMLAKTGMNLIVEIEINRTHHRSRYDRRDEDNGFEFMLPSARLFIIRADGQHVSI